MASDESFSVVEAKFLGNISGRNSRTQFPVDIYYLRFRSNRHATLAAKLFLPVGQVPNGGWPVSIWCHGFGDPATQFFRWPFVDKPWQETRGMLAGGWARHGIATLSPWLPGDGPSEPIGTYSPFSLDRNAAAIDLCVERRRCESRYVAWHESVVIGDSNRDGTFDSSDLVLIFAAGEYEDGIESNSVWETGDWNGDGDFDTTDLVFAFQSGGYLAAALSPSIEVAITSVFESTIESEKKQQIAFHSAFRDEIDQRLDSESRGPISYGQWRGRSF